MLNTSPKMLSRFAVLIALVMSVSMGTALAQLPSAQEPPPTTGEKDSIQDYLNHHPEQARQLHENPSLINDPNWLSQNPKVANWMQRHPDMKGRATADPHSFVNHSEMRTLGADHRELDKSGRYLGNHPEIRQELAANPKLIDDPKYLAQHPGLDKELASHPQIRQDAMNHPEAFKKAMERNDRYNERHHKAHASPTATHRVAARK
jgi:hypothetical protein